MALVPVADDAKTKSYYKYYEQGIPSLTPDQVQMVMASEGTLDEVLDIEDRAKMQDPGTLPTKFGFYPTKDDCFLAAGNIPMPDVTAEMMYWWFAWHGLEPLRYAIWDPEDHFDVQINEEGRRRALDPTIPMEEKTWGATHTVQESIGGPASEIVLMFQNPADLGYDLSKIGTPGCEFMVCCNALLGPMKVPVVMTEVLKKVDGIMTLQARFWIGYHIVDGQAKALVPVAKVIPAEECRMLLKGLLMHNIKEFSNLNRILPSVYAENKDQF